MDIILFLIRSWAWVEILQLRMGQVQAARHSLQFCLS